MEKEEAKQQRGEREMTRGVEGWRARERDEKGREHQGKGEEKRETVKAVSGGKSKRGGGVSPMAATHHSQLNDAIFFPLFPLLFHGRGWGGSAGIQSDGVKQSSYPSGGTEEASALQRDQERPVDQQSLPF